MPLNIAFHLELSKELILKLILNSAFKLEISLVFKLSSRLKWLIVINPCLSKRATTTDYKKVHAAHHPVQRWVTDSEMLCAY